MQLVVVANTAEKRFKKDVLPSLKNPIIASSVTMLCIGKNKQANVASLEGRPRHVFAFDPTVPKTAMKSYLNSLKKEYPGGQFFSVGIKVEGLKQANDWEEITKLLN